MRVGILGSGLMGGRLGTTFARAGHEVMFSYARSEQELQRIAREAQGKAQAGIPREAAQEADAVLLAVHWSRIEDVLNQTGKTGARCSSPARSRSMRTTPPCGVRRHLGFVFRDDDFMRAELLGVGGFSGRSGEEHDVRAECAGEFHSHVAEVAEANDADFLARADFQVTHR